MSRLLRSLMMHSALMTEASKRLKFAREKAGYETASDAARAMGVTESTYLGHEGGNRGFASRAPRYARFFGVSVDWLLTGRGDPEMNALLRAYNELPPEKQRQAMDFIEYLRGRKA